MNIVTSHRRNIQRSMAWIAEYIPITVLTLIFLLSPQARAQLPGREFPVSVGAYLDGVFPSTAPGSASGWQTVRTFPNLTFTDPMWLTPWPGTTDLLMVERTGRLKRFPSAQSTTPGEVITALDWRGRTQTVSDEQGIYSAVFHPDFADPVTPQRYLFICYCHQLVEGVNTSGPSYWRLTRVEFDAGGTVVPGSETILISLYDPQQWHQGGAMFFGPDGFLYLTNGDGGGAGNPYGNGQVLDRSLFGCVIRIDVDQTGGAVSHPIRRQPGEVVGTLPGGVAASYTQNYYIPSDNPWVDAVPPTPPAESTNLEEIYALGLRSPHTMHHDEVTGQVWIGDVGGGAKEEMSMFELDPANPVSPGQGPNFGWSVQEGFNGPALPGGAPGVETRPIHDYGRSIGTCIIGGFVYRGALHTPALGGKVLFGDNRQAKIWSMSYTPGQAPIVEELARLSDGGILLGGNVVGLTNICRDHNDEVVLLYSAGAGDPQGKLYTLEATSTSAEPPALLSQTGIFTDLANMVPSSKLLPFDVNAPLWSDRSLKKRWMILPNDGSHDSAAEKITYSESDNWVFPAGTVLVKHFELPTDVNDPTVIKRLETRFIVCLPGGAIYGMTYRWLPDDSDAVLLTTGETGDYDVRQSNGSLVPQTWQFPSRSDCITCHNSASGQALGVRTHQMKRDLYYGETGRISPQLETWNALGMFDVDLSQAQIDGALHSAALEDETMPLEFRVRSYLDSNCSHCHRPGASGPGFDARLTQALCDQFLVNEPLRSDIEGRFDLIPDDESDGQIIPGQIGLSAVHFRLAHAQPDPASMPPIAKNVVDADAVQKMTDWIQSLTVSEFDPLDRPVRVQLGGPTENTSGSEIPVTVVFDKEVADFDLADLVVSNGTVTAIHGSGYFYTVMVQPNASPVTVQVPEDTLNGGGDGNQASNLFTSTFLDQLPPEVLSLAGPASGLVQGAFAVDLTFSESVTGFGAGSVLVSNGSLSSVTGSGANYSLTVTPTAHGYVTVRILPAGIMDLAGMSLVAGADLSVGFGEQPLGDQLLVQAANDDWFYLVDNTDYAGGNASFSPVNWDGMDTGATDSWDGIRIWANLAGGAPQATWAFTGIPSTTYGVFTSWKNAAQGNVGDTDYTGTDGFIGVTLDQQPGAAFYTGVILNDGSNDISFAELGNVTIADSGFSLTATINPGNGQFIFADAVAIGPVPDVYQLWAGDHGLVGAAADWAADPDGDQFQNLLEFAFNLNPGSSGDSRYDASGLVGLNGPVGLPRAFLAEYTDGSQGVAIEFIRRKGLGGQLQLTYIPQFSSDMENWDAVAPNSPLVTVTSLGPDWELVTVEDPKDTSNSIQRFGRIMVRIE